ncbi:uncharacterized protein PF3D7_1120000-like [Penaeus vannamei]|uniref:uncharacterized protein PF3D7_1120000-like n=1 Tax=Penaeus vannamei TaxID=6689 RepID=UPI00387F5D9C
MSHSLRIVNTFFKKAERHRITYKSRDAESKIDYILCRMSDRGSIKDCKVILDKDTQSQFVAAARDKLQQSEREGNRSFEEVTEYLRKLGERLEETWWWNDEVQESLKRKKEAKKTLDMENKDEIKEVYKLAKKEAKKSVARAKARAYQVLYEDMETIDGQKRTKLTKDEKGNVLVENAEILKRWQEYFSKLMNEENPRKSRKETQRVVEKRPSEITSEEVENAMKMMKNGKAVGPDNLPVEVWKSLGITGIEYLKQELNKIMEEEKIPE